MGDYPPVYLAQDSYIKVTITGHVDPCCYDTSTIVWIGSGLPGVTVITRATSRPIGYTRTVGPFPAGSRLLFFYGASGGCRCEDTATDDDRNWRRTQLGPNLWYYRGEDHCRHDCDLDDIMFTVEIIPAAPTLNPEPTYTRGTQNTVSWNDLGGGTYEVQRATDAGFSTDLVTASTSATSYTFTGLDDGQTYYYRVRWISGSFTSDWSNVVHSTQDASPPLPAVTVSPTVFMPSAGQTMTFTYTITDLTSGVSSWDFTLYGEDFIPVRRFAGVGDVPSATFVWDGTDDGGNPLPDGQYTVVISGTDNVDWTASATGLATIGRPDFSASWIAASSGVVAPGASLTYTVHLINTGNVEATGVVVTCTVPNDVAYLGGGHYISSTREVSFDLGDLAVGASRLLSFVVQVDSPLDDGTLLQSVGTVDCTGLAPRGLGSATARVGSAPAWQLDLSPVVHGSYTGDRIDYTISYQNTGNMDATGVVISDPVPIGVSVISGTITSMGAVTGGTVVWNIGSVPAGAGGQVGFSVRIGTHFGAYPTATPTGTPTPTPGLGQRILSGTVYPTSTTTLTSTAGTVTLTVPAGAVANPTEISGYVYDPVPEAPPGLFNTLDRSYRFHAQNVETGEDMRVFVLPFTLTLAYDPGSLNGVAESSLRIWYYHQGTGTWEALVSTVDKGAHTVTVVTTDFAVLGMPMTVLASEEMPTVIPTVMPTPTATATEMAPPEPTLPLTGTATNTATPAPTAAVTQTVPPEPTPTPTAAPTGTATPTPTAPVIETKALQPTAPPTPASTPWPPTAPPTDTATPALTETPMAIPTITPTSTEAPTPEPESRSLLGSVWAWLKGLVAPSPAYAHPSTKRVANVVNQAFIFCDQVGPHASNVVISGVEATPEPAGPPLPPPPPAATATATPQPTATATATPTPQPTATRLPTNTPRPTVVVRIPTDTPYPTATPTESPMATPTPQPVAMAPTVPDMVLEGVVFYDRDEDGVQDEDEHGISGVRVIVRSKDDSWLKTTLTDEQGRYTFHLPGAGAYRVYVQGMPYPFQYFTTPSVFSIMMPQDLERLEAGLALRFGLSRRILWLIQLILLGLLLALLVSSVTAVRIRQAVLERNRLALDIADQMRNLIKQGGTHVRS